MHVRHCNVKHDCCLRHRSYLKLGVVTPVCHVRHPAHFTTCPLGSRLVHVCVSSSLTQPEGSLEEASQPEQNASEQNGHSTRLAAQDDPQTWGEAPVREEDWQGSKPLTWKDVDWGLAGLLGVILILSFGAYRVLDHFRVYQHSRRPPAPQISAVVERQPAATASTGSSTPSKTKGKSKSKQDKGSKSSSSSGDKPAFPAAAAAAEGTAVPEATAVIGSGAAFFEGGDAAAAGDIASAQGADAAFDIGAPGPSFDLPSAGTPGAPQPSPLDAGFSSSLPAPWAGPELSQMDFAPLLLPEDLNKPPELPSIQVDPPAKAVTQAQLSGMPTDPSLPSLRERAHIAMRASGAAMEASQRAAAYSAAASSAASRAAEAAEQAAAAASAVQSALEAAAEDAMAEAVKRMNRAVEMVADAESRAAAAAAMATAYQDISDAQAVAASTAADLPAMPVRQAQQGHIANLRQKLHEQMFSAGELLGDWVASIWAAIVGAAALVQAAVAGAWASVTGTLTGIASGVSGGSSGAPGASA